MPTFAEQHPHPGDDPATRLRHTLDVYAAEVQEDDFAVIATIGAYSGAPSDKTGLTWGDLRKLANRLGA